MIKKIISLVLFFLIIFNSEMFAQQEKNFMPGEIVIKVYVPFRQIEKVDNRIITDATWFNSISQSISIREMKHVYKSKLERHQCYYIIRFPADISVSSVVGKFKNQPMVIWAEPNFIYYSCATANDTYWDDQWGPKMINCPNAWDITSGRSDIIIAVIDDGPDINHEDLQNQLWVNPIEFNGITTVDDDSNDVVDDIYCYDAVGEDGSISPAWHGTLVAGVCCAQTDNNTGIAGLAGGGFGDALGARLMAIHASHLASRFTATNVAEAIRYAYDPHGDDSTDDGADVINMSFSGTSDPDTGWNNQQYMIEDAVEDAYNYGRDGKGTVLVSASGNNGALTDTEYPGHYNEVIAVGGVEQNGNPWSGTSSYEKEISGMAPDIWAPGDDGSIISTDVQNDYDYIGKTSAASPHVAGVAALVLSVNPDLEASDVKDILLSTTQDNDIVDAYEALRYTLENYGGTLSGNVLLHGDLTIKSGATLVIEPGTTITFAANQDDQSSGLDNNRCELTIQGKIEADTVTFTSSSSTANSWYGIVLDGAASTSYIKNSTIKYARRGIIVDDCSPTIERNDLDHNQYGIWVHGSSSYPVVKKNDIDNGSLPLVVSSNAEPWIYDNKSWGLEKCLYIASGGYPDVRNNTLYGYANGKYQVYITGSNSGITTASSSGYGNIFTDDVIYDIVQIDGGVDFVFNYDVFQNVSSASYDYIDNNDATRCEAENCYWDDGACLHRVTLMVMWITRRC